MTLLACHNKEEKSFFKKKVIIGYFILKIVVIDRVVYVEKNGTLIAPYTTTLHRLEKPSYYRQMLTCALKGIYSLRSCLQERVDFFRYIE